ncbi:MAG: hypothetical protein E5Y67_12330 [Mesorhizobium sp.]|uniref:hypothetical protein n=1 Tax=Mesorhizobium sp. TaxID=1871066 RepID=UPI00120BD800|nr:hypothetical protein [Mesorhizobium sp.]TIM14459.1 MAG: hypothetical protein E5Y67_12330 [Mesorhizobium sp.]
MLPGILGIAGFAGTGEFSATFIGYTADTSNLTTYTFVGVDIGQAHPGREVWITVNRAGGITSRPISSATIGGVAATIHEQQGLSDAVDQSVGSGIISAALPTGTTATIAITFSGANNLCVIGVNRVLNRTNVIATAGNIYTGANPNAPSTTIDVGANGALIAAVTSSAENGAIAWTGVTEVYDATESGGSAPDQTRYSGALSTGLSVQVARPVSTSQTASSPPSGSALAVVSIT